jgi:glycosyltransferase involved in cell wall biosynthesis
VYAGRVAAGRDLGTLVRAAPRLAPLTVTVLGPGDARGLDLRGIEVRPALPIDDVDAVLRDAGLALVPLEDGWENHRVALPNKLFQAVRAGVPVVAADLPALRAVVRAHDLGTLYRPGDPDALVAAVRRACADHARHAAAVRRAAPALSWEADADRLLAAYAALEPAPAGSGAR